ncbi:hypothetical protein [Pusillimonas sp. ANT_WB101]|uniref:hypothetical protein n=1 Tax=Pusillimonas sp. ANT_WB101 TaxID=2597356 RepID=UPI0011EDD662|nr:hypothetical protein [Pusillimonas sp. ANT_WB101]KAA0911503.1 hypothetical protein FQ179_06670 [Pusillimonas sp. ANT_WB101]
MAKIQVFLFLGLLLVVVIALFNILRAHASWQLSLTAQTEIIDIKLVGRTQWDIGQALVCERLPGRQKAVEGPETHENACGSQAWQALKWPDTANKQLLDLTADVGNPINVKISTQASGVVYMALRRDSGPLGFVSTDESDSVRRPLASQVNVSWRPRSEVRQVSTTVLPFAGHTKVGHDVAWSVNKMLQGGQLAVFAASEDALAGRTLAEESTLMLGDQVVLAGVRDKNGALVLPKGFVRFTTAQPDISAYKTMDVVMFAPAEGVDIERYGGGKYSFQASWWVKVKHQSTLVIALVLLTGFLTLASSLLNVLRAMPDVKRWCWGRRKKAVANAPDDDAEEG